MTTTFQLRRAAVYLLILPIAIALGFMLSQPESISTMFFLGILVFLGSLPVLMKWHHALLIIACNATVNVFFLPGQPSLWVAVACLSLFFAIWKRTITHQSEFLFIPSLTWPLVFLGLIIVVTAAARGGVGLSSLGSSSVGTKRYIFAVAAIIAFFALVSQKIPKKHALLCGSLFFLSGTVAVMSDLIYVAGPNFYFLYYLFPSNLAVLQASHDILGGATLLRLEGVASASLAFACFMLARYGAREILDFRRPWRMFVFILAIAAGLFGGFRGRLFLIIMFFVVQFCLEGLWRTRLLPILLGLGIVLGAVILPFTEKLPEPVQRALSFLPVEVSSNVKQDAESSIVWRVEMWQVLWPEVPKYLWLGKGYAFSQADFYLTELAEARGVANHYESAILAAEYHNGPLSILIPFGIWGFLAFTWFVLAGWRALYRNYRYGDKDFRKINTFFLTYYTVKAFFFFAFFGSFYIDLLVFTSVVGLSLAINSGVKKKHISRAPVPTNPVLHVAGLE